MIYVKKFIEKVSLIESRQLKDLVIPVAEARGLRDELAKLLADLHENTSNKSLNNEVLKIDVNGGTFK